MTRSPMFAQNTCGVPRVHLSW